MEQQDNLHRQPLDVDPEVQTNKPIESDAVSPAATSEFMIEARYRPLYLAALKGDWESAKGFLDRDPNAVTARITSQSMTALHVAAIGGQSEFIEKLVGPMSAEEVVMQDVNGDTALHHYVPMGKSIKTVQALVRKNAAVTQITNNVGYVPLFYAFPTGNKEVLWYLSLVTTDEYPGQPFTGPNASRLVFIVMYSDYLDIMLYLVQRYPNLAMARTPEIFSMLLGLAVKAEHFPSGSKLGFWESCIYRFVPVELNCTPSHLVSGMVEDSLGTTDNAANSQTSTQSRTYMAQVFQWFGRLLCKAIEKIVPGFKQIRDTKMRHKCAVELVKIVCESASSMNLQQIAEFFRTSYAINAAAFNGVVEIITICIQSFPDLLWNFVDGKILLKLAILNRQEKIFNILIGIKYLCRSMVLQDSWDTLHQAAKLAPSPRLLTVSGSALQMQRELQWFKEVEKLLPYQYKEWHEHGKTARELFTEEHKELVEKGEKWMKDTSTSCMVVATLIATVVFAAAFTVPGGYTSDKGIPIYLWRNTFMMFAVSDALGLFSSLTSVLMFLSILTARYAEEDFLKSLPKKLIIGLASLFFAIAAMMVAFGATLSIVLSERLKWVCIPITLLASFPVTMFALLQLPLFIQMIRSTYGSGVSRPRKI